MIHENEEKNAVYLVFEGDIAGLADKVTSFCEGKYGDRCEFYTVAIERTRNGDSWRVHEFESFDERAARAVENHLKASDTVKVSFGGEGTDYAIDFIVCRAGNTGQLARYIGHDRLEEMGEDQLVVLTVERKSDEISGVQRELLEELER